MKRITRDRRLTPEEVAKYTKIRKQIEADLPDLIAQHHKRMSEKTMKQPLSPLPYELDVQNRIICDKDGCAVLLLGNESDDDAAFVVAAINLYPQLIKALQQIVDPATPVLEKEDIARNALSIAGESE